VISFDKENTDAMSKSTCYLYLSSFKLRFNHCDVRCTRFCF